MYKQIQFAEMAKASIEESVRLLRELEPPDGYFGCFSGGKDSGAMKHLTETAGVSVRWHYNVTTIDPPELVYFIRKYHQDVQWLHNKHGPFFRRMVKKGFPTRRNRWCCAEYKEAANPVGEHLLLGVRAAESPRRASVWSETTWHKRTKTYAVLPILRWSDAQL